MAGDDDIAETLIEGDPYEQAVLNVQRTFPLSLRRKVHSAIFTLAASILLAPALVIRRDAIETFEGTSILQLTISSMVLFGVVVTFVGGVLLIRHRSVVQRQSLTEQDARRLVRIEDLFFLFAVHGMAFVIIPTVISVAGVVFPGSIETLYTYDVAVYTPANTVPVDARVVSLLGALLSGGLLALSWIVQRGVSSR